MNQTQTVYEALLSEMKKGATRSEACRTLNLQVHRTYQVITKEENDILRALTKSQRTDKNKDKFARAKAMIEEGKPYYRVMEICNINVTTLTGSQRKYLSELKGVKERYNKEKINVQYNEVVALLNQNYPMTAIGQIIGLNIPLFKSRLTDEQRRSLQR